MYLLLRSADDSNSNSGSKPVHTLPINGVAALVLVISLGETVIALLGVMLRIYAANTGASRLRWDFWFVVGATVGTPSSSLLPANDRNDS